ncbi:hypothetical protein G7Y79_00010g028360 [Physcia stellaris]|nr:hypothetical protein G7Y79_00010g028360 [Physcia stellaris]
MQFFTTPAMVALLTSMLSLTTTAAPPPLEARQGAGPTVTFSGAGPNPPTYTLTPPFRGENITITNPLSVSHISVDQTLGVCSFQGIDGSRAFIVGAGSVDVGPPQTQLSLRCCAFSCIGFPQNCCA